MKPIAFVTGAAQGIGLATSERLLRDGFRVVAMDRSAATLQLAVDRLQGEGADVRAVALDICNRAAIVAALEAEPRIDAMVCVAAISEQCPVLSITDEQFRRTMDVNVLGSFIPAQEAARRMAAGGRIVMVSSRAAVGGSGFAHYVASKAAVVGLTRAMAMELREQQIAVNAVAPGFTDTPMTRAAGPEHFARWESIEPSGRAARPEQIAHAIAFLASADTGFITGQTLFVDGGKSLGGQSV